jgi:hypothetical protein
MLTLLAQLHAQAPMRPWTGWAPAWGLIGMALAGQPGCRCRCRAAAGAQRRGAHASSGRRCSASAAMWASRCVSQLGAGCRRALDFGRVRPAQRCQWLALTEPMITPARRRPGPALRPGDCVPCGP